MIDIAEDVKTRFDTSNFELDRSLRKEKNKKVIGLMKDELGGKIMKKFVELRAKAYSYLIDDGSEDKKTKGTKKCVIKRNVKYEVYKNCLETNQLGNKIYHLEIGIDCLKKDHKNSKKMRNCQRFKSERHNDFTEEINKIALSSNDDKRMQSIDSIETYAYGTSKDLVSEKEVIKFNNIMKQYKND